MTVTDYGVDFLDEIKKCPVCGCDVVYGDMIWLNGQCTCPECYQKKRDELDRAREDDFKEF